MKTSRKKEYRRPVLEDLGTAKDLTRGGRGGWNGTVRPGKDRRGGGSRGGYGRS